ncbi:MAG: methionyl-tRNA formyltransferase [bacterium TMED217]|nr:MAG: methionyl-tRNA formyltransferase [bacterium TMED217]|tara:strand:+ start:3112 stop:4035 length:924 start_codon:yes stop_codon:yes gene_type:complete
MKIAFMGNPSFALPPLAAISNSRHEIKAVVSNPPKPMGRKRILKHTEVGSFALENKIDLIELDSFNDEVYKKLISIDVDIFVVVAFRILPEKFISIPKFGSINLHASILPKYRGAAPIQWALMNGENTTGVSVFQIEKKVDTGKIIIQNKLKIEKNDNFEIISDNLSNIGAKALIKSLNLLEKGDVDFIKQDNSIFTKAPKISKDMLSIRWDWSAEKINNWIRGLSPRPGMTTKLQNKKIKILKASVVNTHSENEPGKIKIIENKKLQVYTGKGLISILEIQQEGKKSLPIEQFLRGINIVESDLFY